jgi:hypothetical protein
MTVLPAVSTNDGPGDPPRINPRLRFVTTLVLQTDAGQVVEGHTTDVSLGGAFLHTDGVPSGVVVGEQGVAAVTVSKGDSELQMVFPCTIARITPAGIGLNFDEPEEGV